MNFGVKLFLCAFLLLFYNNCGPQLKSIDQTSSSYTKTQCTGERKVVGTANDDTLVSCENTFSMEGLDGKNTYQFHTTNTVKLKDFNPNSDALDFRYLTEAAQASQGDLIQDYVQLQAGRNYYEILVLLSDGRFKKIATLGNFPVESTSLTFDDLNIDNVFWLNINEPAVRCGEFLEGEIIEQRVRYQSQNVPHGSTCSSETQYTYCGNDGQPTLFTGEFQFESCEVLAQEPPMPSPDTPNTCSNEKKVVGTPEDDTLMGCEMTFSMEGKEGQDTFQIHSDQRIKIKDFNFSEDLIDLRFLPGVDSQNKTLDEIARLTQGSNYLELEVLINGAFKKILTFSNLPISNTPHPSIDDFSGKILLSDLATAPAPSEPPKVDGGFTPWMAHGQCSKECGGGLQHYTRTCTNPAPQNGGAQCQGETSEQRACNTQACPMDPPTEEPPHHGGGGHEGHQGHGEVGNTDNPMMACGHLSNSNNTNHAGHGAHMHDASKAAEHMAALQLLLPSNANHHATKSGYWSDPTIWSNGVVPDQGADIHIPEGLCVIYDRHSSIPYNKIRVDGGLAFSKNKSTRLYLDTLVGTPTSHFIMGSKAHPLSKNISAEIVIHDSGPIDKSKDPKEIGKGLVLHGNSTIHGYQKAPFLPADLTSNNGKKVITSGATTIKVKEKSFDGKMLGSDTWQVGDEIVIMGTQLGSFQDEKRKITAINQNTITFSPALSFEHSTPSFQTSNNSGISELNIYVGNISRNAIIRSEYTQYADVKRRGHVMFMHNPGADVRYASFRDLGRTDKRKPIDESVEGMGYDELINQFPRDRGNPAGRYPLHFHRNGTQVGSKHFVALGNAVAGSPGWGITHHDSYGAVNHNFVYDIIGAGIVAEDGNEVGEWIGNFVTGIKGAPGRDIPGVENVQKTGDSGFSGVAYECQSRILNQQDNIAANAVVGWSFMGIRATLGAMKQYFDTDGDSKQPYHLNPNIVTTKDPNPFQVQYQAQAVRYMGHMEPQFVQFFNNEMIALDVGIISWHRRSLNTPEFFYNQLSGLRVWNVNKGMIYGNYRGGYHHTHSLFVNINFVSEIDEKTVANSFSSNHFQNISEGIISIGKSLNDGGVFYNNSETGSINLFGKSQIADMTSFSNNRKSNNGQLILFGRQGPQVKSFSGVSDYRQTSINITSNPMIGPKQGGKIDGTISDGFGTREMSSFAWLSKVGADNKLGTGDDKYSVEFKGFDYFPPGYEIPRVHNGFGGKNEQYMDRTMDWDVLLKLYGTYKKGQTWVMPIPIWVNDFKSGKILPIIHDFPIKKESEEILKAHELAEYPIVDLEGTSWGNPNFNTDGSAKSTRTYYRKAWRVPYDR